MQTIILVTNHPKLSGKMIFIRKSFLFGTKSGDDDRNCTITFIGAGSILDDPIEFEDNSGKKVEILPCFTLVVNTTLDRNSTPQYQITDFKNFLDTAIGDDNEIKLIITSELTTDADFLSELHNLIEGEVDEEIILLSKHT